MPDHNTRVVVFGGGTGLSNILRGLKKYPLDLTAVVTVGDDGGSSGVFREMFGMTPPGDIRKVLVSLSKNEDLFNDLFNYRFEKQNGIDSLEGHTVGNIILAALSRMNDGNMSTAIEHLSKVLNIDGKVLPVANEPVIVGAEYTDKTIAIGESNIQSDEFKKIKKVFSTNKKPHVNQDVIDYIKEAEMIVFSQGSLYTSLIPSLFFDEIKNALKESKALKIYIANVMTQKGETTNYKLSDHVKALADVIGYDCIDCVIANDSLIVEKTILDRYEKENAELVFPDIEKVTGMNVNVIASRLIYITDKKIRHDNRKLAATIFRVLLERME